MANYRRKGKIARQRVPARDGGIVRGAVRRQSKVDSIMVLRARRGTTGSKYVTFRGGLRRAIPFLLVGQGHVRKMSALYGMLEAGVRFPPRPPDVNGSP
jgi:hypothetical protein